MYSPAHTFRDDSLRVTLYAECCVRRGAQRELAKPVDVSTAMVCRKLNR
jgi:hypothetical protein